MRLAGYQPQYFPRLHYLARMLHADLFAFSDHLQFVKTHRYPAADGGHRQGKSYQADTPVKSARAVQYLTVPIRHHGLLPINETLISYDQRWQEKHLKGIQTNYGAAKNISAVFPHLTEMLSRRYDHLAHLNITTTLWAVGWILGHEDLSPRDVTVPVINAFLAQPHPFRLRKIILKSQTSLVGAGALDDATDKIIATCQLFSADEYFCGGTAVAAYLDAARLQRAGIQLTLQEWTCRPYTQQFPELGFLPNLSILDLLLNEDPERARDILRG